MERTDAARMFKALGDPTRLRIFQFLARCGNTVSVGEEGEVRTVDGPTVGDICCHVTNGEKITSTVSFHLKELRNAGLISVERRGKHLVCRIDSATFEGLVEYLCDGATEPCC